jgi:hypothetical protein
MKLFFTGIPVSPSRVTDVFAASGGALASRARCAASPTEVVPFAGLGGTARVAPIGGRSTGYVSVSGASVVRPLGMSQRKRHQHIDLDPRPRPLGGCG